MVRDGASIERNDGHVADQKMELPRTGSALFSNPLICAYTVEIGRPVHFVTDTERAP
jgi:hypothetical protein